MPEQGTRFPTNLYFGLSSVWKSALQFKNNNNNNNNNKILQKNLSGDSQTLARKLRVGMLEKK